MPLLAGSQHDDRNDPVHGEIEITHVPHSRAEWFDGKAGPPHGGRDGQLAGVPGFTEHIFEGLNRLAGQLSYRVVDKFVAHRVEIRRSQPVEVARAELREGKIDVQVDESVGLRKKANRADHLGAG